MFGSTDNRCRLIVASFGAVPSNGSWQKGPSRFSKASRVANYFIQHANLAGYPTVVEPLFLFPLVTEGFAEHGSGILSDVPVFGDHANTNPRTFRAGHYIVRDKIYVIRKKSK